VTLKVEWETDDQRMERCDHDGTTEPLNGLVSVMTCTECGQTWPARLGARLGVGAATVQLVKTGV
jgi:hypothetical protein